MNRPASLETTAGGWMDRYGSLIKSRQTFLLTLTGLAGYLCQGSLAFDWLRFFNLAGSLFLTICGCTILNMIFDRDIDRKMARTAQRPLATGQVDVRTAAFLGGGLLILGLVWALSLSRLYFILVLCGAGLDVLVYTLWLKRISAWSIFWGGLSGGMPVLAGRALALGHLDSVGLLLAFVVICWIPSHNLTLAMLYPQDFCQAGVPTFPEVYGRNAAQLTLIFTNLLTAALMGIVSTLLHLPIPATLLLGLGGLGLVGLAIHTRLRGSEQAVRGLFKYSSFYMLGSMLLLALVAII